MPATTAAATANHTAGDLPRTERKPFQPPPALPTAVANLPKDSGYRAHALRDLAQYQQYRPGCGGIGRELNDLFPLGFVHGKELLQKLLRAVNETADGGIEIVADLLPEQQRSILEVLQLALRGGVTLIRFLGQRGVLLPCVWSPCSAPGRKDRWR